MPIFLKLIGPGKGRQAVTSPLGFDLLCLAVSLAMSSLSFLFSPYHWRYPLRLCFPLPTVFYTLRTFAVKVV